jgi:molybdenum cofactor cytidylyltransferase
MLQWRMPTAACDCIVPAAGESRRMGTWKPLIPFGRSTLIQTVVETALQACGRVILVTGHRGGELAALFRDERRVRVVGNGDWPRGMFSSLQCGARNVDTERFFVTLGDMPWITPAVYAALLESARADAVFPVHGGMRGHPVLFNGKVIAEVLESDPAAGSMREIASRFTVQELAWGDDSILRDVDTREDLG